jgi:hypothetical protein
MTNLKDRRLNNNFIDVLWQASSSMKETKLESSLYSHLYHFPSGVFCGIVHPIDQCSVDMRIEQVLKIMSKLASRRE